VDAPPDGVAPRQSGGSFAAVARIALALGLGQSAFQAFLATLPVAMVAVGRPDGEIGVAVGAASIFTVIASLAAGGLIDRYGGARMFVVGAALLFCGSAAFALGIVRADSPLPLLLVVRCIQGAGIAATLPAALSLVPALVSPARLPTALASAGVAANVSLAIVPPVTLIILDHYGLGAVGLAAALTSASGAALLLAGRARGTGRSSPQRSRRFRVAWRPEWAGPLVTCTLFIVHWGVVTSYLPQRAEAVGADIGLFFSGDAVALLAARIPGGMLVGRLGSMRLVIVGLMVTSVSIALLLLPLSTPLLVISGAGTGLGAALVLPAVLIDLSTRSGHADRGSAFALYGVSFGVGIALGSIGGAPLIGLVGFSGLIVGGIGMCVAAAAVALWDSRRWTHLGGPASAAGQAPAEPDDLEAQAVVEAETEATGA
jgi:MFS family permease